MRLCSNSQMLGTEDMFVVDYADIHEKLSVGDKILVDYGGIVLTVIGFESEDKYFKTRKL